MICNIRTYTERIQNGDKLSEADRLHIERLIRRGCEELAKLEKEYDEMCIKEWQRRKAQADPTTNEEDRRSWRQRGKKNE